MQADEKNEILKDFPKLELSYELINHNKVYDANFILAIPDGKKCFAWFTTYKTQNVCLILDIDNDENKQIMNVEFGITCFNDYLSFGTIFYGTKFKYENTTFFSLEDIYYYKGKEIKNNTPFIEKMGLMKQIFTEDIKQVSYFCNQIVFGLPIMETSYENILNKIGVLPYKIKYLQFRYSHHRKVVNVPYFKLNNYNNNYEKNNQYKNNNIKNNYEKNKFHNIQNNQTIVFKVKPDIQNDIYHLYAFNPETRKIDFMYDVAYVPDYTTSVMLNKLFRNIKENANLDALEESDDEEEFEDDRPDKFVFLDKEYNMICNYNHKYKKWTPISLAKKTDRVITKNDLFRLEKNNN